MDAPSAPAQRPGVLPGFARAAGIRAITVRTRAPSPSPRFGPVAAMMRVAGTTPDRALMWEPIASLLAPPAPPPSSLGHGPRAGFLPWPLFFRAVLLGILGRQLARVVRVVCSEF